MATSNSMFAMPCTLTPHLTVRNAAAAIAFYKQAFGAEERYRLLTPDESAVLHAELDIGEATLFLNDEWPDMANLSPEALGNSPVTIHLQVDDADAWFERALRAGAKVAIPLQNMFWGDRYGKLVDPFGHQWSVASHVEDLTPDEISARAIQAMAS